MKAKSFLIILTLIIAFIINISPVLGIEVKGSVKEIYNETSDTYVTLENAIPVKDANITLIKDNVVLNKTTTDNNGKYLITANATPPLILKIEYSTYKPAIFTVNKDCEINHVFIPDIVIIGCPKPFGVELSKRLMFYDPWMPGAEKDCWILEHANFAFLYMQTPGTGQKDFWIQYLGNSPANKTGHIAAYAGMGEERYFNIIGGSKNSLENTYLASYYVLASGNATKINYDRMVKYISYLLNETTYNPIEHDEVPIFAGGGTAGSWGLYHPDLGTRTVLGYNLTQPSPKQIKQWIEENPGLAISGNLKWLAKLNMYLVSSGFAKLCEDFENWYNNNKPNLKGPFIVVVSYWPGGQKDPTIDMLIRELEKRGRPAFDLYQIETQPPASKLLELMVKGINGTGFIKRGISAVISLVSWSLNYDNLPEGAVKEYLNMNIPIIKGMELWTNNGLENPLGTQFELTWQMGLPYREGVFGPTPVSYRDERSGRYIPIETGIKKIVDNAIKWAKLREIPNKDKRIAIIIYNYPPGKDNFVASYLDVFKSIHDLLTRLKELGYSVSEIPTPEELYNMVAEGGNKGTWAQPALEKYVDKNWKRLMENNQLIPLNKYLEWFNQLPDPMKRNITGKWGEPPGNIMTVTRNGTKYIVIPGVKLGNIFIAIQPSRGWEEVKDYHDPYLPPHHQYVAFYKWLEENFDAMIHLGTHGTLEWLPGRTTGVIDSDYPFQLTCLPNIYPYIVSNPGEGLVAKDRSFAVIIDHMTPAMVESGLYGNLSELHDLIHRYNAALEAGASQLLPELEKEIIEKAASLGFKKEGNFTDWLRELHIQLHEIENDVIPLGLHSLGKILEGDELVEELYTIASSRSDLMENIKRMMYPEIKESYYDIMYDPKYEDKVEKIKEKAKEWIRNIINGNIPPEIKPDDLKFINETLTKIRANEEWQNLLNALSGGYVPPGLAGDPARSDVLPTGRNFYPYDVKKMPTKAAWESAKKIVDDMLRKYYKEHGKFPELVGMVMWGTELLRTEALAIAEFMYLLGVKPDWAPNGDVKGVVLMDPSEFAIEIDGKKIIRPRIDVFTTAVTYNQAWIDLMNKAVELASEAKDVENYVAKHYKECNSLDRVFGLRGYVLEGTGVCDLVPQTGKWNTTKELADVYLSRVSYAWKSVNGVMQMKQNKDVFQYLLKKMDIATQTIDSTWRLFDTDDYYDWYGGLILASKTLGGNPETMLQDIRNLKFTQIRSLKEEVELEIRSQVLNPKYMESLLKTPSGWMEYAKRYEYTVGIHVTTNSVSNELWNKLGENLIMNLNPKTNYEAFATQSMIAWVLEMERRSLASLRPELKVALANKYITLAVKYGPVCCHHTCANINFNLWVIQTSNLPLSYLQKFAAAFAETTGVKLSIPGAPTTPQPSVPGIPTSIPGAPSQLGAPTALGRVGIGTATTRGVSPGISGPSGRVGGEIGTRGAAQAAGAAGKAGITGAAAGKAYEITPVSKGIGSPSSVPFAGIIGVIILIALIAAGYLLRRPKY